MTTSPYDQVNSATFVIFLRQAICETWEQIKLLENDPPKSFFYTDRSPRYGVDNILTALAGYLWHMIDIGEWRTAGTNLPMTRRSSAYMGQNFSDEGVEFAHVSLMQLLRALDSFWYDHGNNWNVAPEGVFDSASNSVIAVYRPWAKKYYADRLARIEADQRQEREATRARLPPSRRLPHDPDPSAIEIARDAAIEQLTAWKPRLPGTDGLGNPTTDTARTLAEQHLIAALTGHWFMASAGDTLTAMQRACDYAARGLPSDPALHAWTYEQWQHVAIAAQHKNLGDMLWELRRETWDHNRIRPVNWLICRIRILDLFHHGGTEAELRELLEKCRLGLFAEQLPPELQPDFPLMRNWYHLLHAIIHRDQPKFDERLVERQGLLAEHWTRGGGIAPVSLIDLGGWALLRTAKLRGLKPAAFESEYLPREVQES